MIASRIEDMLYFQVRLDDFLPQRVRPSTKYGLKTLESGAEGLRHLRNQSRTNYERLLAARMGTLKRTNNGLGQP